jgi:hypothetical protein
MAIFLATIIGYGVLERRELGIACVHAATIWKCLMTGVLKFVGNDYVYPFWCRKGGWSIVIHVHDVMKTYQSIFHSLITCDNVINGSIKLTVRGSGARDE